MSDYERIVTLTMRVLFVFAFTSCFYYVKYTVVNTSENDVPFQPFAKCCADYLIFDENCVEETKSDYQKFENPTATFIYNYFRKTKFKNAALYITAQSALETAWWKDEFHRERNNYWSRKIYPNGTTCIKWEKNCLIRHNDIEESCKEMEQYLIRKEYSTNADVFLSELKSKGFAEDKLYIDKIKNVAKTLESMKCR